MSIEHLATFNIALLVAIASPGPALLVAGQTALRFGRRAGISIGCGLGLMAATWTMLALLGLESVFRIFPWFHTIARFIGGIYLIYIAWRMYMGSREEAKTSIKTDSRYVFRQGIMINATNPKSVLFAAAVLVAIFPKNMTLFENAIIVANHVVIEISFYILLSITMDTKFMQSIYLKSKFHIDMTAAFVLGVLGLSILKKSIDYVA